MRNSYNYCTRMKTKQAYFNGSDIDVAGGIKFLVILMIFIASAGRLSAQEAQKYYAVKVYTVDNKIFRGVLKSADEKGVYLQTKSGGKELFIDKSNLRSLNLRPRKASTTGVIVGGLTGLVIGAGATLLFGPDDATEKAVSAVGTAGLTFIGAAIGGSIGSRSKEIITINGKTEDYSQNLARIRSFSMTK